MTRNLVADVNANGKETFLKYADHIDGAKTEQFGSITGFSLGLPAQVYNQIFVFDDPARDNLAAAVDWIAQLDVPFRVGLPATLVGSVSDHADDLTLVKNDEILPGMAMASLEDIPPNDTATTISEVTDSDTLEEFVEVFSDVFGLPPKYARRANPESMLADEDIRLFVGRSEGQAVACGQGVQTDDIVGIYSIGVKEQFRRQGIGEAMSWEVLRAGREAGCQVGTLTSTEMGRSLYQQMGFETVVNYHFFEPRS